MHTYHEGNHVADWLSKWGSAMKEALVILEDPSVEVANLLEEDARGDSFSRLFRV